ncbi:MAG TPA: tRNA (adenosine(37)-N6)-dimethylallyltransferase MiaA [Rikenellaceae bacterium]|nr:tRNA (adenosine(37)-N6)-dimethylallyltransferase MiaA [Rikenellaceae bacterium]
MSRKPQNKLREAIPIPPPAPLPEPETIDFGSIFNEYASGAIDLIVVLGPTASGKTRYAVDLARRCGNGEILSADSRQVYRGMDIGTGKDLNEYGDVPYHLIDIVPAGTRFDLYQWQQAFEHAYKDIRERGKTPILCGGTGLYIQAATCGYTLPQVPPNEELRDELERYSTETLISKLKGFGPLPDEGVLQSKRRIIRALEVAMYEREHPVKRTGFMPKNPYYIGTLVSREERVARIDRRLDERLAGGMIEEVKGLLDSGIPAEDLVYYGLEYKFVTQYVLGVLTYEEMHTLLTNAIHQFAKRQMTWFRGMEKDGIAIHWTEV